MRVGPSERKVLKRTPRKRARGVFLAFGLLLALPSEALADPPLPGPYNGTTSQGLPVSLRVSKTRTDFVPQSRISFNACGEASFQRLNPVENGGDIIKIGRTGSFSGTLRYRLPTIDPEAGGTRTVSGRFGRGGRTVSGTFRIIKGGCDSGPITFTARKASVALPAGSL